jgi:CHAT domain-containing protein
MFLVVVSLMAATAVAQVATADGARIDVWRFTRASHAGMGSALALVFQRIGLGLLDIEERGQDVEVEGQASERVEVPIPPRWGRFLLHVSPGQSVVVRRRQPNHAAGELRVAFDCTDTDHPQRDWLLRANESLQRVRKAMPPGNDLSPLLAEWETLERSAPDGAARALALHATAQALLLNGRSVDAIRAFAAAENAWVSAGDAERALAARVGRIETLYSAGRYVEVANAYGKRTATGSPSYFEIRLRNAQCVALRALEKYLQARDCYRETLPLLEAMDEQHERVLTMQNAASAERALGHDAAAADMLRKALPLAIGPSAPTARGRIHLQLAALAAGNARLAESLRETNAALAEFSGDLQAENTARWQANTLIQLAQAYTELGTLDEAYLAVADAFAHLSARDARERVALALEVLADIDRRDHREGDAARWLGEAQRLYTALGLAEKARRAHVAAVNLRMDAGDAEAIAEVERLSEETTQPSVDLDLLVADAALRNGDVRSAARRLDAIGHRPLAISQRLQLAQWRSRLARQQGDAARAERILRDARDEMTAIADATGSAALRYLLLSTQRPLRAAAFAPLFDADADIAAAQAWEWLAVYSGAPLASSEDTSRRAQAFDRALTAELLPSLATAPTSASRALVDALAAKPREGVAAVATLPIAPLAEVRRELPAGTALMAWLDAGDRSALLWVTRERAWLAPAASPREVRDAIAALRRALRNADTPIVAVDAASSRVSAALWAADAPAAPPARLVVIGEDTLNSVPWSLLHWPGHAEPLIETTTSGVASLVTTAQVKQDTTRVRALVASQAGDVLPELRLAQTEPGLIRAAGGLDASVSTAAATRGEVLDAFDDADAIVHIAAHGIASKGRLGYSGLWLAGSDGGNPDFLSWLDVIEHRIRAPLIVLNACQLGEDSGAIANGSSSFAQALVLAGANQIVAAQWPVSDSATGLWVPAFYAALAADPGRDGWDALRAAQLRLRQSRAFRHPYYWASLAGFSRMAVGAER